MKFRSYNQELLIAQGLLANLFNDIVIDRREHGLNRDYSKAIDLNEIVQKKIEVPCIFGDKSIILRSLENESGAIKLPLFILESKNISSDINRQADLYVDVFYQEDESFSKLPIDHPLYRPYNLNKRRGLPITINYDLILVAKYKEDLDQMMTNWMVHMRPDVYVKWWHPRNKTAPLESEILWNQSINIENNADYEPTKQFQWQASTSFMFKTWIFPGLNSADSMNDVPLVKYVNFYNLFNSEKTNYSTETDDESGNVRYPVVGDIYNNGGMFTVEPNQPFEEAIENVETPGIIDDLTMTGDVNSLDTFPKFNIWQDYVIHDPIMNECIGFKFVYFKNGYPMSSFLASPPSGDFLLQHFYSERPKNLFDVDSIGYNNPIISAEFGTTFTDPMIPEYNYDIKNKILTISGINDNERYKALVKSEISSTSGMTQIISLKNTMDNYPIELTWSRVLNKNFNLLPSKSKNVLVNANVWNYPEDNENEFVKFNIEIKTKQQKLKELYEKVNEFWYQLDITETNAEKGIYQLTCEDELFYSLTDMLETNRDGLTTFMEKVKLETDSGDYTVILNNFLYFVLFDSDESSDIYDWGLIDMPKFTTYTNPIFNVTIPQANLVYGISVNSCLEFH